MSSSRELQANFAERAAVHLALSVAAAALIVYIVEAVDISVPFVFSGLAAVATANLVVLTSLKRDQQIAVVRRLVFPAMCTLISFALGSGGLIAIDALLGPLEMYGEASSGPVAFGGLLGVVGGMLIWRRNVPVLSETVSSGGSNLSSTEAALMYFEDQASDRLTPPHENFDGFVLVGWYPSPKKPPPATDAQRSVIGRLRVVMVGNLDSPTLPSAAELLRPETDLKPKFAPTSKSLEEPKEKLSSAATARLVVDGGVDRDEAHFRVKVLSSSWAVFPSESQLSAPLQKTSRVLEFVVLDEIEDESPPTPSLLIDIAQSGSTIQVVQLDTRFSTGP